MDIDRLIQKLLAIEALHAGATTPGERLAAAAARERILARLATQATEAPPIEYTITLHDHWSRKLFIALARRYSLKPFRRPRQKRQTVMIKVPRRFMEETLWPEFQALQSELLTYLDEAADRVIAQAIHGDTSDAE